MNGVGTRACGDSGIEAALNGDGVVISTSINDDLSEALITCFLISPASIPISYFDVVISVASSDVDASFD